MRVIVGGPELVGLDPGLPGASVRLLLPSPGSDELVLPAWNGNEFLLADGSRPLLRTLTPRHVEGDELTVDVVLHGHGPLSTWATSAAPGSPVAVSGTGRGYEVDADARAFLLAGDEAALPAISQLLEVLPVAASVQVILEVGGPDGRMDLPRHPGVTVRWTEGSLVDAVRTAPIEPGTKVWAAGAAAAMQQIRTHLFEERGVPRADAVVRGYWKG
jgi:NADPH-dependent ferric siderophore reductase